MLLFGVWEGRNGARPQEANELACRLAATVFARVPGGARGPARHRARPRGPDRADRRLRRPRRPRHRHDLDGRAGRHADDVSRRRDERRGRAGGAHGSTRKLAHAVAALLVNAYRNGGGELPDTIRAQVEPLFDEDAERRGAASPRDRRVLLAARAPARRARPLGRRRPRSASRHRPQAERARVRRRTPASVSRHGEPSRGSREGLGAIERGFFGSSGRKPTPRALVFTDTFFEVNGVAGTMRRLAAAAAEGSFAGAVVVASHETPQPGTVTLPPDWSLPLPSYEAIDLRFPLPTDVLERIEAERPDVIQVATPGPVGVCGLAVARLVGIPVVGSYHTELGPYALHLTHDALVADAIDVYVDWFYRQCGTVLAPTRQVAEALRARAPERRRLGPRRRLRAVRSGAPGRRATAPTARRGRRRALPLGRPALAGEAHWRAARRVCARLAGEAGTSGSSSPATGRRDASWSGRLRPGRPSPASWSATSSRRCTRARTSSASRARPTRSGRCCSRPAPPDCPSSPRPPAVRSSSSRRRTGALVPPDEPRLFAAALLELADDPGLRRRRGAAGRAAALERTWPASVAALARIYREVLGLDKEESLAAA